jgi:hypothetical protein
MGDVILSTVAGLASSNGIFSHVGTCCVGGNDDDMANSIGGDINVTGLFRCRGGLCAASRLLFGRTVRRLLAVELTGSI